MSALPIVHTFESTAGSLRELAIAKLRELADKLESGELNGARCEWREGSDEIIVVELAPDTVRLRRYRHVVPALKLVEG
jgi:hypothetical protein